MDPRGDANRLPAVPQDRQARALHALDARVVACRAARQWLPQPGPAVRVSGSGANSSQPSAVGAAEETPVPLGGSAQAAARDSVIPAAGASPPAPAAPTSYA